MSHSKLTWDEVERRLTIRESMASRRSSYSYSDTKASIRPEITKTRDQWSNHLDFLLSCLGYSVGLYNIAKFPYTAFSHGGVGDFIIPYSIMVLLIALPVFVLELSLGQFSSSGPMACWEFCPLFRGVGVAMAVLSGLTAIYYIIIICWIVDLLIASCQSELPWTHCGKWSSPWCHDRVRELKAEDCLADNATVNSDGTCTPYQNSKAVWLWNRSLAYDNGFHVNLAVVEYYQQKVFRNSYGSLSSPGSIRRDMFITLLFAWVIVFLCIFKGVKLSGKVAYVTAISPYIILVSIFVRVTKLEGWEVGVLEFITPKFVHLTTAEMWKDAALHVVFSVTTSYGGLITLASYSKFRNDVIRDSFIVCLGDCFTSVLCGIVSFAFIGAMAHRVSLDIKRVTSQGVDLVFGVYPYILSRQSNPSVWTAMFFIMLLFLGIDTQFVLVDTVLTTVLDSSPVLRTHKVKCVAVVCLVLFILGIPMTTDGGLQILALMEQYAGDWNIFFLAFCECIAVGWIYGVDRFLRDINVMLGGRCCCFPFNSTCQRWWGLCWKYITPCISMTVVISVLFDGEADTRWPPWAYITGMTMQLASILCVVCTAIYYVYKAPAGRFKEKLRHAATPTKYWGPALLIDRFKVKLYIPDLKINPDLHLVPQVSKVETRDTDCCKPVNVIGTSLESFYFDTMETAL